MPWWQAENYWPLIEPWVTRALSHGGMVSSSNDILSDILNRKLTLFVVHDDAGAVTGFAATRVENYTRMRVLLVMLIGGRNLRDWKHLHPLLEEEARRLNCTAIEGYGRKGWERVAQSLGYKPLTITYRKTLT